MYNDFEGNNVILRYHHSSMYCALLDATKAFDRVRIFQTLPTAHSTVSTACCAQSYVVYVHTWYCSSFVECNTIQYNIILIRKLSGRNFDTN